MAARMTPHYWAVSEGKQGDVGAGVSARDGMSGVLGVTARTQVPESPGSRAGRGAGTEFGYRRRSAR